MIPGAVAVMAIIIVLSFLIVVAVMYYGTRSDNSHAAHETSQAVSYWTARAEKIEARLSSSAVVATEGTAADNADDEAEKQRKREEALARKAARAAKQPPATE
jgi:cytoskeletal protein RodZ